MATIAVLPGDGIGPEVTQEAVKVLRVVAKRFDLRLDFQEASIGGAAFEVAGTPLPDHTLQVCQRADAILFGAVGGPHWDTLPRKVRPEQGILALRRVFDLYANLRPAKLFPSLVDASTLKREVIQGVDLLVVRELTGGLYFGQPKGIEKVPEGERGVDTCVYTTPEIERIARIAFQTAQRRKRHVTSVDKANVLASSELWRRVVTEVGKEFPEVRLDHMYADNASMQLVRQPRSFDVIVAENTFGDILSDEAAMLTGSIGLLPSASLGKGVGLFEPIHGSAPDIAGQDKANPIAAILSGAMLLEYSLKADTASATIQEAVSRVLDQGYRTPDIQQPGTRLVGTCRMGDLIAEAVGAR
ncbi:MAG TPA: 3-isopropylmalate dehydrogenase [Candidatus Acidoferrum sp.]|nr:3-isopropylmalate dehydrogenase [Candidatus Acidoferrum sp.]